MRRRLARSVFVLLCGALATALGVASALLFTPAGLNLLARILSDQAQRLVRGTVHVGSVQGGWLKGFTLDDVVVRDTSGVLLASVPHLEVRYELANLAAGRIVAASARLIRPEVQIIKHRSGRVNYEEIFRLGERPGGSSPLIELRNFRIEGGRLTLRLPWHPDGRLRTARQIDSSLAVERARPGRRIEPGPEGLEMVRTIEGLNADLPLFRIATPDRQPLTVQIARLAARVSDPALQILDLRGRVRTKSDSLLFELDHLELPGTSGRGSGRLDWPKDTILYHFNFQTPKLALADLRFVSPQFPDFTGSARVQARSLSGSRTEFDVRDLSVGDGRSKVAGRVVAISDVYRGLGFRGLDVNLSRLSLEVVRPYLDTLPFSGTITGRLDADGFSDRMTVSFDWVFRDARVPGAESRVALDGDLRLGGPEGTFFHNAELSQTDLDLRTVRLVAPAVILPGRLGLSGHLNGPWKNVVFRGRAEHSDGDLPASRLNGTVRLDSRNPVLGLETDVLLDSLFFDGIRPSFPTLPTRGALGGHVKLSGTLDQLTIDANVGGALGRVEATGRVMLSPPRWGADSLRLRFEQLDLATLMGTGPRTALQGVLDVVGRADSAAAPEGHLGLTLGPSRIREFAIDSAVATLHAADSVITLDTMRTYWRGGRVDGAGTIGWVPSRPGRMKFHVEAGDLAGFDSLASRVTGFVRDTSAGDSPLGGRGRAELTVDGSIRSVRLDGVVAVDSARWLGYRGKALAGHLVWAQGNSALDAEVSADSLWRYDLVFAKLHGHARGQPDSLTWQASGGSSDLTRVSAGGRLQRVANGTLLHADSLDLELQGRRWGLLHPMNAVLKDSLIALDTVRLVTGDGSGSVQLAGELPRRGPGELTITALGVQLRDIYSLIQRDTSGIAGVLGLDARLSGTARAPEIRGSATLTGPVFGDFHAPLIRAAFDYRQQLLRGNLTFWRTGRPVVEADVGLPLDLALQGVARRQLPGPISIIAHGDSIDLALAEAFTPNLRQVTGVLHLDARIEGTWDAPRLAGEARVSAGAATIQGLGVRYQSIFGTLRLSGDSILAENLRIGSRTGELQVGGGIRLERLTTPILGLTLTAHDFELIDVSNYMRLRTEAEVQVSGTLTHPVLTGSGKLTNSVIYFADLIQKDIINLEDPLYADLVDTLAIRKYSLGASFQSRFLDSLTVRDLQFEVGEGVWLRSNEANFQLEGRVLVSKTRKQYRLDGTLDTPRGTYTLKVGGVINRTFTVERGTVRYFGDLNAGLDVRARHIVRTPQNAEDLPVIAHITGTLLAPKLSLTTPSDRTPMSEPQLISLLMLGTADPAAAQFGAPQLGYFAAVATTALSSELQRALISAHLGVDLLEIRPAIATSGFTGGGTATPTQVAIGRALTSKLFVTANAGFCLVSGQPSFSARNLGANLEYRFRRDLKIQLAAEPIQTCLVRGVDIFGATRRYQFGADLRWDRDY